MRKWLLAVVCAVTLSAAGSLDATTAQQATGFMEWLFDVEFTAAQRARYGEILAATWRGPDQGAKDAVASMARIQQALPRMTEGQRTELRAKAKPEFLRLLEAAGDGDSQWLLGIVRPATTATATMATSSLTGGWENGYISSIQYQETYTRASAPTNGRRFAYVFKADGTYSFTGLMQNVLYQCTTTLFAEETGRYVVEGNTVTLKPEKNPFKMTNTCAPSSNREGPGKLTERRYRFRIAANQLELMGDDGAPQTFSRSR